MRIKYEDGENLECKAKTKIIPKILTVGSLLLVAIGFINLYIWLEIVRLNKTVLDSNYYFETAYELVWIGTVFIIMVLKFFLSDFAITNQRVLIKNNIKGEVYSIPIGEVEEIYISEHNLKHITYYKLNVKLKSFKTITYPNHLSRDQAETVIHKFNSVKINYRKPLLSNEYHVKKRIPIFLLLSFIPLIISVSMVAADWSNVNSKFGNQKEVISLVKVADKKIEHGKYSTSYSVTLQEGNTETSDMSVNENLYYNLKVGNIYLFKAKKGGLGLMYNIKYYTLDDKKK